VSLGNVRKVLGKEIRETLRDRRTLMVMLVVPVFLYPALMVAIEQLAIFGQHKLAERPAAVAVQGGGAAVLQFLARDTTLRVTTTDSLPLRALKDGRVDAVVAFAADDSTSRQVRVFYDASRDESRRAHDEVGARLSSWSDTLLARRLSRHGLPAGFARPLAVADSSVATAEKMGGYALGRFLPALFILMTLLGAFFPSIDLTAGEKERGTLETLLTTPVRSGEIVAGKFLTVCFVAVAAAALNVVSMLLTFESGLFQFTRAMKLQFSIPVGTAALVLLFIVPLAVFFAALFLGIAVRAQSFKEAQNALTPVQIAAMIPIYLPLIPGIPLSYTVALVPIGGVAVLFRDLMVGQAPLGPGIVAVVAMVVYALLALWFAVRAFGREEVLFGTGTGAGSREALGWRQRLQAWRGERRLVPRPTESLAFVAFVALLFFYLGVRLAVLGLEKGLFASQWLLLALPAVVFVAWGPYRARSTFALRAPPPRGVAAAVLIIAGGIPLSWFIGWAQSLVLDVPKSFLGTFQNLLTASDPLHFAWLLMLVAVTPAVCEELVFRGVLLQGLASRLPPWRAVLASAIVFGAFHLSFETVIRFLPTFWLGTLIAWVAWKTQSIFPGMMMHFLNNAMALLLVNVSGLETRVAGPDGRPHAWLIAAAALSLALGLRLLPRRPAGPAPALPASEPRPAPYAETR
jgi:sodium transport system permease protein